jgi:hypothetical protein
MMSPWPWDILVILVSRPMNLTHVSDVYADITPDDPPSDSDDDLYDGDDDFDEPGEGDDEKDDDDGGALSTIEQDEPEDDDQSDQDTNEDEEHPSPSAGRRFHNDDIDDEPPPLTLSAGDADSDINSARATINTAHSLNSRIQRTFPSPLSPYNLQWFSGRPMSINMAFSPHW